MRFDYPENLRFECIRCGLCCGDTEKKTRHILLLKSEAEKIASQTCQLQSVFCNEIGGREPYVYEMKKSSDGKCVFLKDKQCQIYAVRPLICMFYPFELKFDLDAETYRFEPTEECPAIGEGKVLSKADFKKLFEIAQEKLS